MTNYDATEQAYKNGYEQGKKDAVIHAHWIEEKTIDVKGRRYVNYRCSNCGERSAKRVSTVPYCFNCGAKMDGTDLKGIQQTTLDGFTTCKDCFYGRDVLGGQYACRSEKRRQEGKKLVNKADYTCEYAERKFVK